MAKLKILAITGALFYPQSTGKVKKQERTGRHGDE
jgi:hypothetical protein